MPPAVQTNSFLPQSGLYLKLPWWQQCVPVSSAHPHIRPGPLMQAFHSNEAFLSEFTASLLWETCTCSHSICVTPMLSGESHDPVCYSTKIALG